MSKRAFNEPFLMVPYALLRIPEYGRYFDGAPIGFIHRLFMTGIRRQTTDELRYYKEGGWVTELAKLYEGGSLASYFTLEDIEEATGFTVRRLRDFIKKLEELKLIQVSEFGDGYIFVLGKRLRHDTDNGYSVGYDHEGFFIDSWETWAQKDREGFRKFIIDNLAPPKAKERLSGKILPDPGKDFSENAVTNESEEAAPGRGSLTESGATRIDRVRIDLLQEGGAPPADPLSPLYARIRTEPSWIDAEKAAREALRNGASLSKVNALLSGRVPEKYAQFSRFPRFALRLNMYENYESERKKDDYVKLSMLWKALAEDVSGVDYGEGSNFFTEIRGAYKKNLVSKYSYEQCLWTLKKAVGNTSNLEFLVKGGRNLITLVQQNSKEYHELKALADREEASKPKTRRKEKPVTDLTPAEGFDLLDSFFKGD